MSSFFGGASILLATLLGFLGMLKCLTTGGAIWWLRRHGACYRRKLQNLEVSELNGHTIRKVLDECHGQEVRPWGVLDYRLYRKSAFCRLFGQVIYRLPSLAAIAFAVYLCSYPFNAVGWNAWAWCFVGLVYQVNVALMAFEALYAYIAIGNYRRHYHVGMRLPDGKNVNNNDEMYEMDVLIPLIASAVVINVLAYIAAQRGMSSFHTEPAPNAFALILEAVYFVSTTLVTIGYGDIYPVNSLGRLVTILMHVQSLLLIVGVFSSLMSFGLKNDGRGS